MAEIFKEKKDKLSLKNLKSFISQGAYKFQQDLFRWNILAAIGISRKSENISCKNGILGIAIQSRLKSLRTALFKNV